MKIEDGAGGGRLAGKRALVIGAARGIGAAIAQRFGREGARVACAGRNGTTAEVAAGIRDQGGSAVAVDVDLRDRAEVAAGVAAAVDQLGGIDVLVQSGGITATTPFAEISAEEWRDVLAVNLDGTFHACQLVARHLLDRGSGGSIVVVTSQLAQVAIPGKAHYLATKGALTMLTKAMALELAPHGVRVNALAPGVTRTDMAMSRLGHDDAAMAWTTNRIPMGRLGEPAEMTGAAVFLASDDASYVTGTTLVVDGGYLST